MVQYRAITKGLRMEDVIREFEKDVEDFKRDVLTDMAHTIAETSPVDTGTYARNHEVALRSGSFVPNVRVPENAPRKVDPGPPRAEGLQQMLDGIAGIDISSENFVFRNRATHAGIVEQEFAVYSQARREMNNAVQRSLDKLRGRR